VIACLVVSPLGNLIQEMHLLNIIVYDEATWSYDYGCVTIVLATLVCLVQVANLIS
jgi:hypothetical protein